MACCLVVEDAPEQRAMLELTLHAEGHEVLAAATAAEALRACAEQRPELVLLDLGLPDADGLEVIPSLLAASPLSRIVVITGRDSARDAVAALQAGARHYLVKPWERDELLVVVTREARAVALEETRVRGSQDEPYWGRHPDVRRLRSRLDRLARSPLTPVLVEGETGTGKEVVARELHRLTGTAGPFVALNCTALPAELLESELFGHERGSFTGAVSRRRGLVELACEGTLFLDEVGDMPLTLQAKLLRFVEDHGFRRVGGEEQLVSRCRVVAATHRDLGALQGEGGFRSDLYFRLAVVRLALPPLRERRDDLLPLASFFIGRLALQLAQSPRPLSAGAERVILEHSWPGNLRELRNRLERALVLGEGPRIEPDDLDLEPGARRAGAATAGLGAREPSVPEPDREGLCRLLEEAGWNLSLAARRLGVPRHWLKYRLSRHGLRRPPSAR